MGQRAEVFYDMPVVGEPDVFSVPVDPQGRTFCGDVDIRIDVHGQWHYNGQPIEREDMVCLFAAMLARDEDHRYWLVTPTEMGRIEVDDAPFIAVDMFVSGTGEAQCISFATNVEQVISVGPGAPLIMKPSPVTGAITPYIINDQGFEVRVSHAAYARLTALGEARRIDGRDVFGVWSNGAFFPLGAAASAYA